MPAGHHTECDTGCTRRSGYGGYHPSLFCPWRLLQAPPQWAASPQELCKGSNESSLCLSSYRKAPNCRWSDAHCSFFDYTVGLTRFIARLVLVCLRASSGCIAMIVCVCVCVCVRGMQKTLCARYTQSHACTHARTHTRTHAPTHPPTHPHTHTHIHTHMPYVASIGTSLGCSQDMV